MPDGSSRRARSAQVPQKQRQLIQTITDVDTHVRVVHNTWGTSVFKFLFRMKKRPKALIALGRRAPVAEAVLLWMLACVNSKRLRETGKLIAWPSQKFLAKRTNRSIGQIDRALRDLRKIGFLIPLKNGGRFSSVSYEIRIPRTAQALCANRAGALKTQRQRLEVTAPALVIAQRQRCDSNSAGAVQKTIDLKESIKEVEEGAASPLDAATAAELARLKFSPKRTEQLASIPGLTPIIIRAARYDAFKPGGKGKSIIKWLLENPDEIDVDHMQRAKHELTHAPARSSPAAPAEPTDVMIWSKELSALTDGELAPILTAAVAAQSESNPRRAKIWQDAIKSGDPLKNMGLVGAAYELFRRQRRAAVETPTPN